MRAPKCKVCQAEHYGAAHVWPKPVNTKTTVKQAPGRVVNTKRGDDRHKPWYMNLYMQTRRAIERGLACRVRRAA